MNIWKKSLSLLLVLVLALALVLPTYASAQEAEEGTGPAPSLEWKVEDWTDETDENKPYKALIITGTGSMPDYSDANPAPWAGEAANVTAIVVSSGITYIGANAFAGFDGVACVWLPLSLTAIGENAFGSANKNVEVRRVYEGSTYHWKEIEIAEGNEKVSKAKKKKELIKKCANHSADDYQSQFDSKQHWEECTVCGFRRGAKTHTFGPVDKATNIQTCTECGYMEDHVHEFPEKWAEDGFKHWKECHCGLIEHEGNHTWNSGEVSKPATVTAEGELTFTCTGCGNTRTASFPKLSSDEFPDAVKKNYPWWILAAAALAGIAGVTAIFLKRKKDEE